MVKKTIQIILVVSCFSCFSVKSQIFEFYENYITNEVLILDADMMFLEQLPIFNDSILLKKEQLLNVAIQTRYPQSLFNSLCERQIINGWNFTIERDSVSHVNYVKTHHKIYCIGKLLLSDNYDSFLILINRDKDTTFMERIKMLTNNGANIFKDKIAREIYLVNVIANKIVSISLIASYEYGWNCDLYLYSTLKKNKIFISQMSGFADDLYYHLEQNNENVPTSAVSKENPVIRYFTFDEQGFVKILHNNDE
ncbi:MAG: hypothetical protein LBL18_01580 [Bacteroidales bacterium]|jgi:hypothetical protein|nr:hypothetical protein [Bacteroidales bacterium]